MPIVARIAMPAYFIREQNWSIDISVNKTRDTNQCLSNQTNNWNGETGGTLRSFLEIKRTALWKDWSEERHTQREKTHTTDTVWVCMFIWLWQRPSEFFFFILKLSPNGEIMHFTPNEVDISIERKVPILVPILLNQMLLSQASSLILIWANYYRLC